MLHNKKGRTCVRPFLSVCGFAILGVVLGEQIQAVLIHAYTLALGV